MILLSRRLAALCCSSARRSTFTLPKSSPTRGVILISAAFLAIAAAASVRAVRALAASS
jgi:hypothetical protein